MDPAGARLAGVGVDLPSGTVTFLFTDIEDSTRHWEEHPAAMGAALARHDELLRLAVSAKRGTVFSKAGDGVAAVFARAGDAVDAAVAAQRSFAAEQWPVPIRVRMGLHTGEAEERDGDYFGPALNRASRVMALAAGGQVFVALATAEVVRDRLEEGLELVELGERSLRSLQRPEHVFELKWSPAAASLVVRLLGVSEVRLGATTVDAFHSPRLQSLLAYLVVRRGTALSRQRMALLFWPGANERQARTNLRQALHHLRQALPTPDRYLRIDNQTVEWRADGAADVDVDAFEAAARRGVADGDEQSLRQAAERYGGDLLEGCHDEWIESERDRLRAVAADVLRRLVDACRDRGDIAEAISHGERLVRLEPLDEAAYRRLMELHGAAGDRARALRVYHACVTTLQREIGVEPDPETVVYYQRLVTGGVGATSAGPDLNGPVAVGPPLIGRDDEWDRLIATWRVVVDGRRRFVLVSGEPGIGKSRLVQDFGEWCGREGAATVAVRAYEADGNVPYGPVVDTLRSDGLRPSLERLEEIWRHELGRVLPELLLGEPPGPVPGASADSARRRLFEAIARALLQADRPLVWAIDDLQWCDAETLDLLEFMMRFAGSASSPVLIIATARDEQLASRSELRTMVARIHALDAMVQLPLGRLPRTDAFALAEQLLGSGAHAGPLERLVAGSEGNPLFMVEMARSGLAESAAEGSDVPLPPRVQSVIETRLDQLPAAARDVAAVAAVVGRAFDTDILGRIVSDEAGVVTALDELWRRGLVRERARDSYDFSHDKIREVAYLTIGPANRRRLHAAVAAALEQLHARDLEPVAAQIAHHLDHCGQADAAVSYYERAVTLAARLFAHQEVLSHCRTALELVARRPPGPERDDAELAFLVPLGVALFSGPGIADDASIYERANVLRARRGLAPDASTLRISANVAITSRRYVEARQLGEVLLERGEREADDVSITEGHYLVGVTSCWLGDLDESRRHLTEALRSYRSENHQHHLEHFGQDPYTICLLRLGLTTFQLGGEAEAASLWERAEAEAAAAAHQFTDIYARVFGAWYLAEAGLVERAAALADGVAPADATNRLAGTGRAMFTGWAQTLRGDLDAGLDLLRLALERSRAGMWMLEPFILLMLAQGHARAGDVTAGLEAAILARDIATREMPFHVPEASRLSGELLLAAGRDRSEGVDALRHAADSATRQGNVIHELRARLSLVRALRDHDGPAAAAEAAALRAACTRLPAMSQLAEVVAAREELAR